MLTPAQSEALGRVFSDIRSSEYTSIRLTIGGVEYTRIDDISYGAKEDGPAHVLEADLSHVLPPELIYTDVAVDLLFSPPWMPAFSLPDFRGTLRILRPDDQNGSTHIEASSSGFHIGRTKLLSALSFAGKPSDLLVEGLAKVGYERLNIPEVSRPTINRTGTNVFNALETVGAVVDTVAEAASLVVLDDATNTAIGYRSSSLDVAGDPVRELVVGEQIEEWKPDPKLLERYAGVVVHKRAEDGSVNILDYIPIEYTVGGKPPRGDIKEVEVSDEVPYDDAYSRAVNEAMMLRYGEWSGDFTVYELDPRLSRPATVLVREPLKDGTERRWMCRIEKHERTPEEKSTKCAYTATQMYPGQSEESFAEIERAKGSGGVATAPYGRDANGTLYFDVDWVTTNGEGFVVFDDSGPVSRGTDGTIVIGRGD